jgi:hypothetical protein
MTFELMRLVQNNKMLYADTASKNEQLWTGQFFEKTNNTKVEGSRQLKRIFCFIDTTHETLHFCEWRLLQ